MNSMEDAEVFKGVVSCIRSQIGPERYMYDDKNIIHTCKQLFTMHVTSPTCKLSSNHYNVQHFNEIKSLKSCILLN